MLITEYTDYSFLQLTFSSTCLFFRKLSVVLHASLAKVFIIFKKWFYQTLRENLLRKSPSEYRKIQTRKKKPYWTLFTQWIKCITNGVCVAMPQQALSRSNRSHMFFKIDALQNFATLTRKNLCWRLFLIKSQAWRRATLLKKAPTLMFPVNIAKFWRISFSQNTSGWM